MPVVRLPFLASVSNGRHCAARIVEFRMKIVLSALLAAALVVTGALAPAYAQTAAKPELVRAKVIKIDAARGKVTLDHAPIKSIKMEAMVMPFKVKDPAMLASLKAGDTVSFSVAVVDDDLLITRIGVAK
jgi:Cu/Ag efflux protein CusF